MRAPREYRQWVNNTRRLHGKRNGVVPAGCLDSPEMERKRAKSKRSKGKGSSIARD
jgi:hypothetical protein